MKNNKFYKKPLSNIYKKPSVFSEVTSQILYGEKFKILSKNKNWIRIKVLFDKYIGYIENKNYTDSYKPTHKVSILKTSIFDKLKKKTKYFLPFSSKVLIIQENKNFIEFEKNRWIKKKDIKKIDYIEKDYIKILKLFLKTRYIWGGKTYEGIDCSAILQLLYYYNNKFYPRDTKDQIKYSKSNIKKKNLEREILYFGKGMLLFALMTKN